EPSSNDYAFEAAEAEAGTFEHQAQNLSQPLALDLHSAELGGGRRLRARVGCEERSHPLRPAEGRLTTLKIGRLGLIGQIGVGPFRAGAFFNPNTGARQ